MGADALSSLKIFSPKRSKKVIGCWDGFFPYYAGFSPNFAEALLTSANLGSASVVFDPWNGSGTTTYSAALRGLRSVGSDINPVMVIVAKARLLPPSESDSIVPLGTEILDRARSSVAPINSDDPLLWWFSATSASVIRAIERSICQHLVGPNTQSAAFGGLDRMSGIASTNYVALFSVCRALTVKFRSSNPTWLRRPRVDERRVSIATTAITKRFLTVLRNMAESLAAHADLFSPEGTRSDIRVGDSTQEIVVPGSVDLVLTSPPYCTRIDYTAATRVELAVLDPLLPVKPADLARQMIGTTRVPVDHVEYSPSWGKACANFLLRLQRHSSKASSGYYYRTHVDYFDKMDRSIDQISNALKSPGRAIFVVQDSNYKEIHNDLPTIISEIARNKGLVLGRRDNFRITRTMAGINPRARVYNGRSGAVEAVLCFQKD